MSKLLDEKIATIRDRFLYIVDNQKETSERKLAEKMGVSPQRLNKVIKNGTEPSTDLISRMVDTLKVDPLWLLTGEGTPFQFMNKNYPSASYATEVNDLQLPYGQSNAKQLAQPLYKGVVRFLPDMMVSAGYSDMLASNKTEMLPVSFEPTAEEQQQGIALKVYGDSMEPSVYEGATVFLMPLTQSQWLRISKGVFLFDTDNTLTIKRIAQNNLLGTPGTITLQADNPKYPNLTLPAESIRAIWKVTQILFQPVH